MSPRSPPASLCFWPAAHRPNRRGRARKLGALVIVFLGTLPAGSVWAQSRLWTAKTSVEIRYFMDMTADAANNLPAAYTPVRAVLPSPDGRRFAVILVRGDAGADQNVSELRIYNTEDVLAAVRSRTSPSPARTIERRSASNAPAIGFPEWDAAGRLLLFLSVDPERRTGSHGGLSRAGDIEDYRLQRIEVLDVVSGRTRTLVPADHTRSNGQDGCPRRVLAWTDTDAIVAECEAVLASRNAPDAYPLSVVTAENLPALVPLDRDILSGDRVLRRYHNGQAATLFDLHPHPTDGSPIASLTRAAISPDGRTVLAVLADGRSEQELSAYARPDLAAFRFVVIDLTTGAVHAPIDMPVGRALLSHSGQRPPPTDVFWISRDEAVLVGAALPSDLAVAETGGNDFVASYDRRSGSVAPIAPMTSGARVVRSVSWDVASATLVIEWSGQLRPRYYRRSGRLWSETGQPSSRIEWQLPNYDWRRPRPSRADNDRPRPTLFSNGLSVLLRESANEPQRLVASDGQNEVQVVGGDPALFGVEIAPSRIVEWTTDTGATQRGLLTLPTHSNSSSAPPLVIQVLGFSPNVFRPDGYLTTAAAVQVLAARGVAVLSVNFPSLESATGVEPAFDMQLEGPRIVETIDAAVARLTELELVDQNRVGVMGFSRGGASTLYAITHPGETAFQAAIAWDSYQPTFSTHLNEAAVGDVSGDDYLDLGSFAQDRGGWLRVAPEFNMSNVQTPYLYALAGNKEGGDRLLSGLMGMFAIARRPIEVLNFHLGAHPMRRPREREISVNITADWMTFWLLDAEDPDPAKSEQYVRWRTMREQWRAQQALEQAQVSQ